MNDPYEVLGLSHNADGDAVRLRYLELVRQYPPERAPEKFAEVRAAYDALRDPIVNLENRLFDMTAHQTMEGLAAEFRPDVRRQRLSTEVLLSLGRS